MTGECAVHRNLLPWSKNMTIERFENGPRFCRVLRYNGTVHLAGLTADDLSGDTTAQTREILGKIDSYLAKAGSDKTRLLSAQIWLRDIADFDKMNAAWDAWIDKSAMPVRATVEARLAGDQYRVEIMVTAAAA
jgi:enamine deaminase RidA (YjgF/YER057c/UK114 family)